GDVQYFIGVQLDGTERVRDASAKDGAVMVKKTADNIDEAAKELPDANLKPEDLWANHSKPILPKPHMKDTASWRVIQKVCYTPVHIATCMAFVRLLDVTEQSWRHLRERLAC
ncbi:unnamed protein product, partial [Urochloa humidicola]